LQLSTAAQLSAPTEHDMFHGRGLVWANSQTCTHEAPFGVDVAHEHPRLVPWRHTEEQVALVGTGVMVAQPGASKMATMKPTAEIQRVAFTLARRR
jgi:hypothetical protein